MSWQGPSPFQVLCLPVGLLSLAAPLGDLSAAVYSSPGLGKLEIDERGLEKHDRELLSAIIEKYGGGPVGADTLAITIGESTETLEDFYEPYLIQQGFIQRTPRGRVATPAAYKHLGLEAHLNEDQRLFL